MDIIKQDTSKTLSTRDPYVTQYLDTLDKIYQLTLETNRVSKSSFIHLSKANYLTANIGSLKAFGEDQYDNRDRNCSLVTNEALELHDKLTIDKDLIISQIKKEIVEAELNTGRASLDPENGSKAEKIYSDSNDNFKLFNDDLQQVKNRKVQQVSRSQNCDGSEQTEREVVVEKSASDDIDRLAEQKFKEIKKENSSKDPVKMFRGGMVPKDLRICQSKNRELIDLVVQLHIAKQELTQFAKLMNTIDEPTA